MVLFGVRLLINIVNMFVFKRFLEVYVGRRKTSTELSILILLILAAMGSVIDPQNNSLLNFLQSIFVFSVYSIQYQTKIRSKVVAVVLYIGLIFLTEPIGYIIHMAVMVHSKENQTISYYFIALVLEIIRLLIVEIFCHLKREKKIKLSYLPKEVVYILMVIPMVSAVSCILLIEIAKEIINPDLVVLCMTIIFIIFISNYLMFTMVHRYVELIEQRYEEELSKYESDYKEAYYRDMEESIEQIHDIRHDMKNQLIALYDLLEHQGGMEAKEHIKSMLQDVTDAGQEKYSSNPVVNGILRIKTEEAKKHNIRMTVNTFIPKKMDIEVGDYGILYGNILDNAIEACKKIPTEKRFIDFVTKYQDGKLLITLTNSKSDDGNVSFLTTKADKKQHGRGMKSVRKVCERYHGDFLPKDLGETFQADILLMEIACLE